MHLSTYLVTGSPAWWSWAIENWKPRSAHRLDTLQAKQRTPLFQPKVLNKTLDIYISGLAWDAVWQALLPDERRSKNRNTYENGTDAYGASCLRQFLESVHLTYVRPVSYVENPTDLECSVLRN